MQANQSSSIDRRRKNHLLVALCLAMAGLFILVGFAGSGRGSQGVSEIKLSVEDPRPVLKAIEMLERKYGWVITYEDPRYAHDSEIADTKLNIRKDLNNHKSGESTKFLPKEEERWNSTMMWLPTQIFRLFLQWLCKNCWTLKPHAVMVADFGWKPTGKSCRLFPPRLKTGQEN